MACKPCQEKTQRAADARVTKPAEPAATKGYTVTDRRSKDLSMCEHGVKPWTDCETCQKTSSYHFTGNFR